MAALADLNGPIPISADEQVVHWVMRVLLPALLLAGGDSVSNHGGSGGA
ncbi:MAG: hypothetical protein JNN08_18150 [Bryobacterales bacterium]|nr:hypothetical protein [Bryobacterales bacterium]